MEENKHTELDKLFQSRLNRPKRKEGNWNTPSSSILSEALNGVAVLDEIDAKKRRPFAFIWTSLGALLLIALAAYFLINSETKPKTDLENNYAISQEDNNPNLVESLVPSIVKTNVQDVEQSIELQAVLNESSKVPASVAPQENVNNTKSTFNTNSIAQQITQAQAVSKVTLSSKSTSNIVAPTRNTHQEMTGPVVLATAVTTNKVLNKYAHSIAAISKNKIDEVETLGMLDVNPLLTSYQFGTMNTISAPFETIVEDKVLKPYMLVGAQWSTMSMANIENASFSLTDYDSSYLGYRFGLGVAQQINSRFSMDYQVVLNRFSNESVYQEEMQYDMANEIVNTLGTEMYSSRFAIESPMGMTEEDLVFDLAHGAITDQENIGNVTNIKQYFTTLSFSIGPEYKLVNSSRFSILVKSGFQFNWLARMSQNMDMKLYHNADMMTQKSFEYDNLDQANRFTLGLNAALELEYLISDKFFVGLGLEGVRSLNSIRRSVKGDAVKTYIHGYGVSLSTGYRF